MKRLPKVIQELASIEKLEVKDFNYLEENKRTSVEVIAKDGREYYVFSTMKLAKTYAVKLYAKYQDDPTVLEQLAMLEKPIEKYATERVEVDGVRSVLSYDQHHRVKLTGQAVAFRSI